MRHPATQPPDQRVGQAHQAKGDARAIHDFAGQDEERHGQEREQIKPGEKTIRSHRHEARSHLQNTGHARNTDDNTDRQANNHQAKKE